MRDQPKARMALDRAASSNGELLRSLWLAKAVDYGVKDRASLVGGAAVNLHTGSYRPTDIDMCALLDESDRHSLVNLGFRNIQGDHFSYRFDDGEVWLVEFPDSQVDGDVLNLALDADVYLSVITPESLLVDRVIQATDGSDLTREEAQKLAAALWNRVDWQRVDAAIRTRATLEPGLGLVETFDLIRSEVRRRIEESGARQTS